MITYINHANIYLKDFVNKYLRDKVSDIYCNTVDHDSFLIKKHILPLLGDLKLTNLTSQHLESFYIDKLNENLLDNTTIIDIHKIVINILDSAINEGYLASNPAKHLTNIPQRYESNYKLLSLKDVANIIKTAPSITFKVVFSLGFQIGLSREEIIRLTWNNINFSAHELSVYKPLSNTANKIISKFNLTINISRRIPIPDNLLILLTHLKTFQDNLKYNDNYNDYNFIICKDNGEPLTGFIISRILKSTLKQLDIPIFYFYETRNIFANHLKSLSVPAEVIHSLLGRRTFSQYDDNPITPNYKILKSAIMLLDENINKHLPK